MSRTTAVVVAGGRSARFGDRDKALVPVDGVPMVRRVADRAAPLVDELVVNCRPDQRTAFADALADCALAPRFAVDPVPDRGPVAGLRTGLRLAAGRHAVALACDLPALPTPLVGYLCSRARTIDAAAVVPATDGRRQPLCAAYDVDAAREACTRVLARGDDSLRSLVADLDPVVTVGEAAIAERAGPHALTNVNTPADLDALDGAVTTAPDEPDEARTDPPEPDGDAASPSL
jgi:molybdopterin-guanine dinucleotide biosynthesis protein A